MAVLAATMEAIRRYCAYQDRCHSEVRSKLISLQCYGDELEEAISTLIEERFLDEERFALSYARGKFRMQRWGRIRIRQQLKMKQVSEYCIRKALQQIDDTEYWDALRQLLDKKVAALHTERNDWLRRQKVMQYLMRKGYETDLIQDAWADHSSDQA